ncbi:FMN-binding negative transcriptional regulator [Allokutzneria sp. A3M-2-11 16]|uniref:FMN-binding negative transcriptional regulator n=1 Tax=Allokutzneria sp. A3M-2-11 16 TaxID=2962043 RepID=UPI0020B7BD42|nr:FMN-binding negative transcriptional regulator [Allokutzneria sp. A3M-2-11 16]MCP3803352.1 FMN-binding negative transcriptional regulator [Allokutzneria sp. A3M-2-11 16]
MFVPPEYQVGDPDRQRAVIRDNALAMLVSNGSGQPFITHLPVIFPLAGPMSGELVGTTLLGHLNRANPHWKALSDGCPATLVFTGPHGYISPEAYRVTPAAPTWNFVSVHVRGTVHPIDGIDPTLDVIRQTVATLESRFGKGWDPADSQEYFRRIVPAVGAFRFQVAAVDSMFKLSQEKSPDIQERVMDYFSAGGKQPVTDSMRAQGLGCGYATRGEKE